MTSRLTLLLLAALAAALTLGAAPAQDGGEPEAYLPYLFAAFALTWLAFFAYLFSIGRRERALHRELEALRRDMAMRQADCLYPEDE